MKKKGIDISILLLTAVMLVCCTGRYIGTPRAVMLEYQTKSTYGSLYQLACAQAENLNEAIKADTLHPGMYAEYGVAMALMGHEDEACRMLNAEAVRFPESKKMVKRIKERLLPSRVDDTLAGILDTANVAALKSSWAYDTETMKRLLPRVASVIDSTDTVRIMMQTPVDSVEYPIRLTANQKREMLANEQRGAELKRQAVADSIAAAKQAKINERKEAKAQKAKEKKEKEKAKKQAEKEKKKAAKEKAKQKKAEKAAAKENISKNTKKGEEGEK